MSNLTTPLVFDKTDNLLRVFRLPTEVSSQYCFNGGHDSIFKLVDWFRPASKPGEPLDIESIREFIRGKLYYQPNFDYLVMCRTGETFLVDLPEENDDDRG